MGVVDFPQVNRVSAEVRDAREASDVIPEWPPNKQKLQIGDWEGVRSPSSSPVQHILLFQPVQSLVPVRDSVL